MCERIFLSGQPGSFLIGKSMLIAELPGNQARLAQSVNRDSGKKVMLKMIVGATA
jgi:hypothetical protein